MTHIVLSNMYDTVFSDFTVTHCSFRFFECFFTGAYSWLSITTKVVFFWKLTGRRLFAVVKGVTEGSGGSLGIRGYWGVALQDLMEKILLLLWSFLYCIFIP